MVAVYNDLIITKNYEWALDAIIEALRISRDVGSDAAIIYLRETMWKQSNPDG